MRLAELAEQKAWLAAATQRMAAVALELDETDRRIKLQEEIEKDEKWWTDVNAREKEANAKLMAQFQRQRRKIRSKAASLAKRVMAQ